MKLPQRYLKPELQSKSFKKECKNIDCKNRRRERSAFCQKCSDNYSKNEKNK